jgi:formylglycine-generating enzyme required for sulfatase activity
MNATEVVRKRTERIPPWSAVAYLRLARLNRDWPHKGCVEGGERNSDGVPTLMARILASAVPRLCRWMHRDAARSVGTDTALQSGSMRPRLHLIAAFLFLAACGKDEPPKGAPVQATKAEIPGWAHVAKEQVAEAERLKVPVAFENSIGMRFVLIPAGKFSMGSPASENGYGDGPPQHEVTLTKPYYFSIWATTNAQYRRFDAKHESGPQRDGEDHPVVNVNYEDVGGFLEWLNGQDRARMYRLPTEAEREYATRAGTTTRFWTGATPTFRTSPWDGEATDAVGSLSPNPWGLYEIAENVSEWCADWYGEYPKEPVTDPTGPASGTERVLRSGVTAHGRGPTPSAFRFGRAPDTRFRFFGFRVAASTTPR